MKYKTCKTNVVADFLSRNMGSESYVYLMALVEGTMLDIIKTEKGKDQVPVRLLRQVVEGVTRKFLVEVCKGHRPFVPLTG